MMISTKHIGWSLVLALFLIANAVAQLSPSATKAETKRVRVLLVVAHPDDEYEVAGTLYRITKELAGTVDQLIITDGEAGYRYSLLAEQYYGLALTNEAVGRNNLPRIRREEAKRAATVLGIRHQWFLNEKDDHFTLNGNEVLNKSWNRERVLHAIEQHLRSGSYDFVFILLPTADTHGEHEAASILALQAAETITGEQRPVILGAQASAVGNVSYQALAGQPLATPVSSAPQFQFDRDTRFGFHDALSYQIVVDWVIAEHKSQGLFQTRCRQDRFENFWMFSVNEPSATADASALFAAVSRKSDQREDLTASSRQTRNR